MSGEGEARNRVITLGTDRVVLRVVKPPTTAEQLDALAAERGDWSTEPDGFDPLAPRQITRTYTPRSARRGRS